MSEQNSGSPPPFDKEEYYQKLVGELEKTDAIAAKQLKGLFENANAIYRFEKHNRIWRFHKIGYPQLLRLHAKLPESKELDVESAALTVEIACKTLAATSVDQIPSELFETEDPKIIEDAYRFVLDFHGFGQRGKQALEA